MKKIKKQKVVKYYSSEESAKFKEVLEEKIEKLKKTKATLSTRVEKEFLEIAQLEKRHDEVVRKRLQFKANKISSFVNKKVLERK